MSTGHGGPTPGLIEKKPKTTTDMDRLATDFYNTFNTKDGKAIMTWLRTQLSKPPEVTNTNPNEYAWHYIGERRLMHVIEDMIAKGEKIATKP
jgi:hypothetical protein